MELHRARGPQDLEAGEELSPVHGRHGLHREEVLRLLWAAPFGRAARLDHQAAAGDQAMEVRMLAQVLSPGVQQGGDAQADPEPFLAELEERFRRVTEEQGIDGFGVLQRQWPQDRRQGEDPVVIADR